jgi:hypothetical protein
MYVAITARGGLGNRTIVFGRSGQLIVQYYITASAQPGYVARLASHHIYVWVIWYVAGYGPLVAESIAGRGSAQVE